MSGSGGARGEKRPLPKPRGSVQEVAPKGAAVAEVRSVATAEVRTGDPVVSMADGAAVVIFAKAPPCAKTRGVSASADIVAAAKQRPGMHPRQPTEAPRYPCVLFVCLFVCLLVCLFVCLFVGLRACFLVCFLV